MELRAPRSLVTGACGFVGSHMCEVLVQAGHDLLATDQPAACREDDPKRGWFPSVPRGVGATLEPLVPTRDTLLRLLDGVDYVFHTGDDGAAASLLAAAAEAGVRRLVQVSQAASATESAGLEYAIVRPVGMYGPREVGGALIAAARRRLHAAPRNLPARRSFVHVRDVCRAALHLAVTPQAVSGVYDVRDESELSGRDYLRLVACLTGNAFFDLPLPSLGAQAEPVGDTARLKGTGFELEYPSADRGIRDTLTWYKQEGWL